MGYTSCIYQATPVPGFWYSLYADPFEVRIPEKSLRASTVPYERKVTDLEMHLQIAEKSPTQGLSSYIWHGLLVGPMFVRRELSGNTTSY